MAGLFSGVKASVHNVARAAAFSAAFGVAGLFFVVIGVVSLTGALWLVIAAYQGPVLAFALIGFLYVALGAGFLALAAHPPREGRRKSGSRRARTDDPPPREPLVQIAEGFAIGMQAGRAARDRRR